MLHVKPQLFTVFKLYHIWTLALICTNQNFRKVTVDTGNLF